MSKNTESLASEIISEQKAKNKKLQVAVVALATALMVTATVKGKK